MRLGWSQEARRPGGQEARRNRCEVSADRNKPMQDQPPLGPSNGSTAENQFQAIDEFEMNETANRTKAVYLRVAGSIIDSKSFIIRC